MPNVPLLVRRLREALQARHAAEASPPLVIVDGYHGFGAIPTDLSAVAEDCCYVGCVTPLNPYPHLASSGHLCPTSIKTLQEG